jgi:hypothetical protein
MSTSVLDRPAARDAALRYLEAHYPSHLKMAVLDMRPLAMDAGWVVWPQTVEYIRSHDPMDFLPAQPLLVTDGPTVTALTTARPVAETLAQRAMRLDD